MIKYFQFSLLQGLFLIFCNLILLSGCSEQSGVTTQEKALTVTVKTDTGLTVYHQTDGVLSKSVHTNTDGVTETRSYSYNDAQELQLVKVDNPVTGTAYVYYETERNRADGKIIGKTKRITSTRSGTSVLKQEYCYDEDGQIVGVIQRDEKGNTFAKGMEDNE